MSSSAPPQDQAEFLRAKLISLLGRMLTVEEMREALELKSSTYYDQIANERLLNLDNIKAAARNLAINPIYLLVEAGMIDVADAETFCATWRGVQPPNPLVSGGMRARTHPTNLREARRSLPSAPDL